MRNNFIPDYMFESYDLVGAEFLISLGIRAVITDIDNTLAPYEQPQPDDKLKAWLSELKCAGIGVALMSNNNADRVELFNKTLGLAAYPKSGKPRVKYLKIAMARLESLPHNTIILGDQIFTDVWAGKRLGMRAILVPPIKDKTGLFFKFKRRLEMPFIKAYKKRENKK